MKEIPMSLEGLEKEDVYSVATALLYSLKDNPKYSVVSELFYILDYKNFLNLIKFFGGTEIRIPSADEISEMLRLLLLYQYRKVDELSWEESLARSGISYEDSNSARAKLTQLEKVLKSHDVGRRDYE